MKAKEVLRHWFVFACIVLVVFILYSPVSSFTFLNFDDDVYISANPHVISGITRENITWAFSETRGGHWHPLTWVGHMANVTLFGLDPGKHHIVNAIIHAINAGLVFLIVIQFSQAFGLAIFAALIFGCHPMRLESVAWLSELKDVLSMFFALLTILFYAKYFGRPGIWRYLLVALTFCLGLLCKPTILTLPVLLLLLDYWPLNRIGPSITTRKRVIHCILEKLPLLALSFTIIAITSYAQSSEGSVVSFQTIPLSDRISGAMVSYLAYTSKLFLPLGLGIFYPIQTYSPGVGTGAFLGLMAISWLLTNNFRGTPSLAVGWLWFLIALSPVIGLIQFGGQAYADRWSYLPHFGLILGLAYWAKDKFMNWPKVRVSGCCCAVLACFCLTHNQLPNWKDSISIFSHTLDVSPNNFMAHTNLGSALDQSGDLDKAAPHYEEAYRLNPTYPEAINNLGILRARTGRLREAVELFQKALKIRPNFSVAQANLDLALRQLGKIP